MKISDLLENDNNEWENDTSPASLEYLNKKQKAAVHICLLHIQGMLKSPRFTSNPAWNHYEPILSNLLHKWGNWYINKHDYFPDMYFTTFPTLKKVYDNVKKAKKEYEDAGGKYDNL